MLGEGTCDCSLIPPRHSPGDLMVDTESCLPSCQQDWDSEWELEGPFWKGRGMWESGVELGSCE